MKTFSIITLTAFAFLVTGFKQAENQGVSIGDIAPNFTLKNIDGEMVSLSDYQDKKGVIVIFSCNHCPYVKMYEDRMVELNSKVGNDYPIIAINPNDEKEYPEDSYKKMKKRAKDKGFTFPYLRDETQETAVAYGATRTPHVFLAKNEGDKFKIAYIGAIDDNPREAEAVNNRYVETAIAELEAGSDVTLKETRAIGCGIKWKKGD